MRRASRWAAIVLAATALGVWSIPSRAEQPSTQPSADTQSGSATITGTVMKEGQPLANARVGLIDASQMRARKHGGAQDTNGGADAQGQKPQRPTPTATAMTDSDGKFTLSDIKPGQYVVIAGAKGEGRGRSRINVADGQTATVEIDVNQGNQDGAAHGGKHAGKAGKLGKAK